MDLPIKIIMIDTKWVWKTNYKFDGSLDKLSKIGSKNFCSIGKLLFSIKIFIYNKTNYYSSYFAIANNNN